MGRNIISRQLQSKNRGMLVSAFKSRWNLNQSMQICQLSPWQVSL